MHDLIERQAAIDSIEKHLRFGDELYPLTDTDKVLNHGFEIAASCVYNLPSAQPETHDKRMETHTCDCISRQAAVDAVSNMLRRKFGIGGDLAEITLAGLPSAQPEHTNSCYTNSWCINCKEYDTENKCCPRYNRVIKQTLDDAYRHGETEAEARYHAQQRWIPCSERVPEKDGNYLTTLTDKDGNYVDVTEWQNIIGGRWIAPLDECDYCEIGNVVAWMPLPEPYREEGD